VELLDHPESFIQHFRGKYQRIHAWYQRPSDRWVKALANDHSEKVIEKIFLRWLFPDWQSIF